MRSYLILLGIYSSVVSVCEDVKLRKSVQEFTIKEAKLLDSIGFAQLFFFNVPRMEPLRQLILLLLSMQLGKVISVLFSYIDHGSK
jgi:hypothetical protein